MEQLIKELAKLPTIASTIGSLLYHGYVWNFRRLYSLRSPCIMGRIFSLRRRG